MDKNIIKLLTILLIIILSICFISRGGNKTNEEDKKQIVTSFYPIYIMTINITNGVNNVNVSNMSENLKGCIHDYTLSTDDLKKVENADIFIETGENLEPFSNKIKELYPNVKIVDSGKNVSNLISEDEGEVNPHIWMNTENYTEQVTEISNYLEKIDSGNKEKYKENAQNYINKINEITNKYKTLNLQGVKVVCLDEQLVYLLKQNGMDVISIATDHENSALSADVVSKVVQEMKDNNIKAIFIDKDSDSKNAEMIANETGAKVYKLNSSMNGDNSYDSYINDMNQNYEILEQISNND